MQSKAHIGRIYGSVITGAGMTRQPPPWRPHPPVSRAAPVIACRCGGVHPCHASVHGQLQLRRVSGVKRSRQRSPITGYRQPAGEARSFGETQNICRRCHQYYTPDHYGAHVKAKVHRDALAR